MKKFLIIAMAILFSISMFVPVVSAGCVKQKCSQNTDSCLSAMQRFYDRCLEREAERDAAHARSAARRAAEAELGEQNSSSTEIRDDSRKARNYRESKDDE